MTDDFEENQTTSGSSEEYNVKDTSKTEIRSVPQGSVFEEPDYENKSPTTFTESLKKRWGEIKPTIKTMIVERVDRPKKVGSQ